MSSINSLLANKKEENKKLELQLKSQLDNHNLTLARIDKDHSVTVQELRAQVCKNKQDSLCLFIIMKLLL